MFDGISQAMKVAEKENEQDYGTSRTLNQHAYDLPEQVNEKEKRVTKTMKKVKEAEKWLQHANTEIDKLHVERENLIDVVKIRGDFINHEQNMYLLQFPNF